MIKVLLFANLQEQIGKASLEIEKSEMTVDALKAYLNKEFTLSIDKVMVAINEEYADNTSMIKAGDTVALIPPVSGG